MGYYWMSVGDAKITGLQKSVTLYLSDIMNFTDAEGNNVFRVDQYGAGGLIPCKTISFQTISSDADVNQLAWSYFFEGQENFLGNWAADIAGSGNVPTFRFVCKQTDAGEPYVWLQYTFFKETGTNRIIWHWSATYDNNDASVTYGGSEEQWGSWYNQTYPFNGSGEEQLDSNRKFFFLTIIDDVNPRDIKGNQNVYFGLIKAEKNPTSSYRFSTFRELYCMNDFGYYNPKEIDERFGEESTEEGYGFGGHGGKFDDTSVSIGIPPIPSLSVSNLGYLNVYKATAEDLEGMLEEIFPDQDEVPAPADNNIFEATKYIGEILWQFVKTTLNSGLQKYIVDTHVIPVDPGSGSLEQIKVGFRRLTKNAYRLRNDYVEFDCGTISLEPYYDNFLDLLTSIQLFLPFVGYVPINSEYLVNGGKLHVVYHLNILDGSFNAYVLASSAFSELKESLIGTYSGCCCVHIPLTSSDYSSIMSGIVGSMGSLITKEISPLGFLGEVGAEGITALTSGGLFSASNGFNTSSGLLGCRIPYVIVSRPVSSFSKNYPKEKGLPLNVTKKLSNMHGFTVCENPHLDFDCSEYERDELQRLLKSGIIL